MKINHNVEKIAVKVYVYATKTLHEQDDSNFMFSLKTQTIILKNRIRWKLTQSLPRRFIPKDAMKCSSPGACISMYRESL